MKKILSLLIALSAVISVLMFASSCNGNTEKTTTKEETTAIVTDDITTVTETEQTTEEQTTEEVSTELTGREKMPGYEDIDFGGLVFLFNATVSDPAVNWHDDYTFWVESIKNESINDAVFDRNNVMHELYNCTIEVDASGGSAYDADIASGAGRYIGTSHCYKALDIASSSYYNVLKLGIDFNQEWWDQDFFRDLSCDGKLFSMCGSFSLVAYRAVWICYYNKNVYDSKFEGIDIYQMVRDKQWTFDTMIDFIDKVKYDANGDSEYTFSEGADADILGYMSTAHNYRSLYFAGGCRYVTKSSDDYSGYFISSLNDPKGQDTIQAAITLTQNDGYLETGYSNCDAGMANGTTLFVSNVLGQLIDVKDAEGLRLGVLPMPMAKAGQDGYHHMPDNHATFISIPTSYKDISVAAEFLTLFAYHSYKLVYPAFLNTYKYIYAHDEESGEMVDIILNSVCYDPGYLANFSVGFNGYVTTMIQSNKPNQFTQAATKYTKDTNAKIDEYRSKIAGIDDNY
ncbi:MAG: extracellular solute-binding protein [Clostridiales bacterium]|nr:extracellular solute-binding protein [Clostridiales bacterium]